MSSTELSGPSRGLVGALGRSIPRDELFAGLYILACANALWGRVIMAVRSGGLVGGVFELDLSIIVLLACFVGVSLMLRDRSDEVRPADVIVAVIFLSFVILPIFALSWMAVTGLSLYILLFTKGNSSRKRGAVVLLATAITMLWIPLLVQFFEKPILEIDASIIAWLLHSHRVGNMVGFVEGSGYVSIVLGCSSITNLPLAFLCWLSLTQWVEHLWSREDILWAFLACASAVAVNITRISLMAYSYGYYDVLHNQYWNLSSDIANIMTLGFVVGFSVLGARREIFSRA